MSKKLVENTDVYSIHQYNKNGLYEKYQMVLQENQNLKQTVTELTNKIKTVENQDMQQHHELLGAISKLWEHVYGTRQTNDELSSGLITEESSHNSERINNLELRLQLHENSTKDGHLIWKINQFQKRSTDAITGKVRALHSAPCFTSKYGYKFCLRLYLHGDGIGRGTHLSLFLVIMKSEYDSILEWPFQKKVKFTLINQDNKSKDHVEKMFPSKDSSSFQKPKNEMNMASGCPLFIAIDRLEKEGFLKDDSLFLDIEIE